MFATPSLFETCDLYPFKESFDWLLEMSQNPRIKEHIRSIRIIALGFPDMDLHEWRKKGVRYDSGIKSEDMTAIEKFPLAFQLVEV
jgi:hypothetical protein